MTLRLVVTGGRNYADEATVRWALESLHQAYTIGTLIHGDASGADRLCRDWATAAGVSTLDMPADWNDLSEPCVLRYRRDGSAYNVLAGFNRNQRMIDVGQPNYAVAFPGGRGTNDMCQRITEARIPLWDLRAV